MKINAFPLLLLFFLPCLLAAQTLTGLVQDAQHQPLAFVLVTGSPENDSTRIAGGLTDSTGRFSLVADGWTGRVKLVYQLIGYQFAIEKVMLDSAWVTVPPALLLPADAATGEVEITGRRQAIEVRPDRVILNVASLPGAAGSTAWELLRRTPGVMIGSDNSIRLQGRTGTAVWINGRPSMLNDNDLMVLLQGIPAAGVATIEVMSQPGARFDAAGTGGIIQLQLTRPLRAGQGGSLTTTAMQGYTPKGQVSLSVFRNGDAVAGQLTLGASGGKQANWTHFYRHQGDSTYDQFNDQLSAPLNPSARLAADWKISPRHTAGLSLDVRANLRQTSGTASTNIASAGQAPLRTLVATSDQEQQTWRTLAGLFHRYADTSGFSWQTDFDTYFFDKQSDMTQENRYTTLASGTGAVNRYRTGMPSHIRMNSLRSDITLPAHAAGSLSGGVKLIHADATNDFRFERMGETGAWQEDSARSNAFTYRETVMAAYANWSRTQGKWETEAGLRWEHTLTLGVLTSALRQGRTERQYHSLFPTLAVVRTFRPGQSLRLGLSRRIDRPPYQDLNPFVYQSDELTYSQGNPFLRPQMATQAELGWTWKYKFQVKASYTLTTDVFAQITDTFDARSSIMTQRNMASRRTWSLDASLPVTLRKGWEMYASLSAYHKPAMPENGGPERPLCWKSMRSMSIFSTRFNCRSGSCWN